MGNILNRRRVMGGSPKEERFTKLHEWLASDFNTAEQYWTDHIGEVKATKNGNPTIDNGYVIVKYNTGYFTFDNRLIYLGSRWFVEAEVMRGVVNDTNSCFIADFGSLGYSNHGFCLAMNNDNTFSQNAKLDGNASSSLYSAIMDIPSTPLTPMTLGYGIEYYNDTHSQPYAMVNGVRNNAPNVVPIEKGTFNGNFAFSTTYLGTGQLKDYASKNTDIYIKRITIYKDNRQ